MTFSRLISSATLLACACLVATAGPAAAQLRIKSGAISRFDGADHNNTKCINTTAYKTIPGMSVNFTQGGSGSDPVVVLFEGAGWFVEAFNFVDVRLTIDGVVQPGPGAAGDTFIYGADPATTAQGTTSHGFNFQSDAVSPGAHTAAIQWRSFDGSEACVAARSMIVLHK